MSSKFNNLVVYTNLPSGGAYELYKSNINYLSRHFKITTITDRNIKPKNLIDYLYKCLIIIPRMHKNYLKRISANNILIAYHSWLTKSPHILRYANIPKVYICHEPMREYYDKEHIKLQSIKEKLINIIRLPLKFIDKSNVLSPNTTIIANSQFSKQKIDKAYNVKSLVLYPGIKIKDFKFRKTFEKKNQVISVGAINKLKRYEFLVQVLSKVSSKIRPKLLIVGNGGDISYINHLRQMAIDLDVNLTIKTMLSRDDLIKSYFESKIFLYAPVNEPFGIVVEEAMAAGLPLIVYKYGGGYAEIINKNNGYILNNLDHLQWKKSVESLLINNEAIKAISEYNIRHIQKYSDKNMNTNLLKLLKSL